MCFNIDTKLRKVICSWRQETIIISNRIQYTAGFGHKRIYHMYRDVNFWLSSLDLAEYFALFSEYFDFVSPSISNLPGAVGGASRRPPGPRGVAFFHFISIFWLITIKIKISVITLTFKEGHFYNIQYRKSVCYNFGNYIF